MEESTDLTIQDKGLVAPELELKNFRKRIEAFTKLVNTAPQSNKIQKHQGYEYLPISTVEKELDRVYFGLVQYECISYQQIFNEVACHARIKVFHPVINQWLNYDGLGSAVIQQDKDTKVSEFHLYKKPNAGQLAYPKAYAEAIKNAAKKIGKKFGADINRKFEDEYVPNFKDEPEVTNLKPKDAIIEIPEEIEHMVLICETKEQTTAIWNSKPELHSNPKFLQLITTQNKKIKNA